MKTVTNLLTSITYSHTHTHMNMAHTSKYYEENSTCQKLDYTINSLYESESFFFLLLLLVLFHFRVLLFFRLCRLLCFYMNIEHAHKKMKNVWTFGASNTKRGKNTKKTATNEKRIFSNFVDKSHSNSNPTFVF